MEWNEFFRKSLLGCASIIMTYHITLTILNLTLYPFNPIGEIKFSIGDGDEVRHNKTSIDSLYSCTDEQRKRPLTWVGGLGCVVFCGLDVPIEGDELLRVVLNPGLTDQLVTYQPEHPWVGFHLGNLLCHGEWNLDLRESLIGGLDCLLESLCLG